MEACEALRDKLSEIKGLGPAAQYGLFLADEDPKRGVWLESGRTLEHYLLRENVRPIHAMRVNLRFAFNRCSSTLEVRITVHPDLCAGLSPLNHISYETLSLKI